MCILLFRATRGEDNFIFVYRNTKKCLKLRKIGLTANKMVKNALISVKPDKLRHIRVILLFGGWRNTDHSRQIYYFHMKLLFESLWAYSGRERTLACNFLVLKGFQYFILPVVGLKTLGNIVVSSLIIGS